MRGEEGGGALTHWRVVSFFTHLKLGFSAVLANFFTESGFFDLAKTLKIGH